MIIGSTYYHLNKKKKSFLFIQSIRSQVEHWITEVISEKTSANLTLPEEFLHLFDKNQARQMMIDELVRNKGSFLGSVSENIIQLYYKLGLNVNSKIKLNNKNSHIICQGINELCVMEQKSEFRKIYRLINSPDYDVRMEAQIAIIQWFGFSGLRFLDVITFPITEFQQLKLLEILRQSHFTGLNKLNKWLLSKNDTVVNFALKLAQHYKQVQVHNEAALCLQHTNEAVRVQAVKTLVQIANPSTAILLTTAYKKEKFTNRLNILKELQKIAGEGERDFLIVQLHEAHEFLKVASAKVLATCTADGMEILEAKSYDEPQPYLDIYLHIKAEQSK